IALDLKSGFTVVAPQSPVSMPHEPFAGWWRINPATGDALGMGANGWGPELEEENGNLSLSARLGQNFKAFGRNFAEVFATNYGWCAIALGINKVEKGGLNLGSVKATLVASPKECLGDSIFIGLVGALTMPLVALTVRGLKGPRAPSAPEGPENFNK